MEKKMKKNLVLLTILITLVLCGCVSENCNCDDGLNSATDADSKAPNGSNDSGTTTNEDFVSIPFELSNVNLDKLPASTMKDLIFAGDKCNYAEINTDLCTVICLDIPESACVIATQGDGSEVAVLFAKKFSIDENIKVEIKGDRPLIIIAGGDVDIKGSLRALDTIYNKNGEAGGYSNPAMSEVADGLGAGGGGGSYNSAGAGGGAYCGAGGSGGAAEDSTISPKNGGPVWGTAAIVPLKGGSSGGKREIGSAGAGGGAVQIVSAQSINVYKLGSISMPGNGGRANAGHGAGSGGAILLEAPVISIAGVLAVNGGGGGGADLHANGLAGFASDLPASGGVTDNAANGGAGSAAEVIKGGDGDDFKILTSGGGGGGGAGWIRINTSDGTADITGIISPSMSTSCASIGTITTSS